MGDTEKTMLIVNPRAGLGKAVEVLTRAQEIIEQMGWMVDVRLTTRTGQAGEIASSAVGLGYDRVVVLGGDGTVGEVAAAMLGSAAVLGILPAGRTNDFYRSLGHSIDIETACRVAFQGSGRDCDVGLVNDRPFVEGLAAGFAALVTQHIGRHSAAGGFPLRAILQVLPKLATYDVSFRFDTLTLKQKVSMLFIGIGACMMSGLRVLPQAIIDDGKFDICVVPSLGHFNALRFFLAVAKETHLRFPGVRMYRSRQIEVSSATALPVCLGTDLCPDLGSHLVLRASSVKLRMAIVPPGG